MSTARGSKTLSASWYRAVALETALAIGTGSENHWPDCLGDQANVEKALAACTDFIVETEKSSPELGRNLDLGQAYASRGHAYDKKGLNDLATADQEKAASLGYSPHYELDPVPSPKAR
jgi:hypothetical protein